MQETSFSADEFLQQPPLDTDIRVKDGIADIPIAALENSLDFFDWGTRNFEWELYKDGYVTLCVAASLELVLSYEDEDGLRMTRCFVGACNFALASIAPIPHWLATAKSLCIKNAASDAGRKFGRELNIDVVPEREAATAERAIAKMKPDTKIMKQFMAAVEMGDQATINLLTNIYDIKTNQNGD